MKTRGDVIQEFSYRGETVAAWAEARGYRRRTVYAVLNGELKGLSGTSHRIAVELGLKNGVIINEDEAAAST